MGFPLDYVEPNQEAHLAEFTCAVCFQLVDAPLLTTCHHVFCQTCLVDWMATKPCCPTCSCELDPRHGAGELRLASPLAWRVVGRLRVRCSLPGCNWVGEYSEVTAHLTSSESHQAAAPADPAGARADGSDPAASRGGGADDSASRQKAEETAEGLKAAGNAKFEQRLYADAITLYSKAIALAPTVPTYFTNRAAAHSNSGAYREAIADCGACLRLPTCTAADACKACKRMSRAHVELGELERARLALLDGIARADADGALAAPLRTDLAEVETLCGWQAEGEAAISHGEHATARAFFANMLSRTNAHATRLWLTRAELGLGLCDRALRTTREVIKADPMVPTAYVLRGLALLFGGDLEDGNLDQAAKHLKEALRLDPDHPEAGRAIKKVRKLEKHIDAAKQASKRRDFETSSAEYSAALESVDVPKHAPLAASLHAERAAAYVRMKDYEAALKDCALAIYAQDDCKHAWLTKAQALHALGRHADALADMQALSKTYQHDPAVSHALNRASFEVRKERRADYYALLKVPSVASTLEIKAAYKQRALELHPDRQETQTAKAEAEGKFKLLGEALEILSDDFSRRLYNEGYDKEAIAERIAAANRAVNNHDRDGCCGRGGGCGGGGGGCG